VKNGADGDRVSEQTSCVPETAFLVHSTKLSCIQKSVPVGKVYDLLFHASFGILEFVHLPAAPEIVIILVDLPEGVTELQVVLVVICPVFFRARGRYAAVWALVLDMSRRSSAMQRLSGFAILLSDGYASTVMRRVRAVSVSRHESRAFTHRGDGRVRERVKEVIRLDDYAGEVRRAIGFLGKRWRLAGQFVKVRVCRWRGCLWIERRGCSFRKRRDICG
jgi:hypothetical protein